MEDGWIEHDGKSRPNLPPGTLVLVRDTFGLDQSKYSHSSPTEWEWWDEPEDENSSWIKNEDGDYITHYKVVSP